MNCQAFANDSLTMLYEAIRGAMAADDALIPVSAGKRSAGGPSNREPKNMPKITFAIVADPAFSDCEPVSALEILIAAGMLRRFARKYGKRSGDCHEMAYALVMDLADCRGNVPFKWFWYAGDCPAKAGRSMRAGAGSALLSFSARPTIAT